MSESIIILSITILVVLMVGNPDLLDAIIGYVQSLSKVCR